MASSTLTRVQARPVGREPDMRWLSQSGMAEQYAAFAGTQPPAPF